MQPVPQQNAGHVIGLYKGLLEVGALLSSITHYRELLPAILDVAKRVFGAEASSLMLANEEGNLELVIARSPAGELTSAHVTLPRGSGIASWVFENNRSLLVPDAYADPRFYPEVDKRTGFRTRSILCVPLRDGGRVTGVLQMLNPTGRTAWQEEDLEPFEAYAALAAAALVKVRAQEQERERERLARELALAHEIQESFLPARPSMPAGLRLATFYRPARNIGGDFFDLVETADGCVFTIGDVSGKGIPAALLMARTLGAFRAASSAVTSCTELLATWNEAVAGFTIHGMFVTALVGTINRTAHTVDLACAGHLPPVRVRAKTPPSELHMAAGPPLGIVRRASYSPTTLTLRPGDDCLVFFTDGLVESCNAARSSLGRHGVLTTLSDVPAEPAQIVEALQRAEAGHRGRVEPQDDLTLLAIGLQ